MGDGTEPGDGTFSFYTGENMLLRGEPGIVKQALRDIGLEINDFDITVTGIYARPRPIGFDFYSTKTDELIKVAEANEKFNKDDRKKLSGKFVAMMSKGESFRQIGGGPALHMIVARNGYCNVHIDTAGFVTPCGYDFNSALTHGYFDLATDLLPGAFLTFGESGVAGLMVAPMKGVDGKTRMVFGIGGRWK
ncbi:MAG: hypothetical protein HKN33_06555 [Pyrinomonadaceae bacterium]|nr:hypothetical protein [Pyrinomonadaceae bacterium]